jgi:hypothetical protein
VPVGTIGNGTVVTVPYIPVGVPTTYAVTAIYAVTGEAGLVGYEETPVQTSGSGIVTPTLPIDTTGDQSNGGVSDNNVQVNGKVGFNQSGADFSHVVFSFTTNPGINTYIVDVSNVPNFAKKVTLTVPMATTTGGQTITTTTTNLRTAFPGATELYYRIGDRNSIDSPGPVRNDAINPNPDLWGTSRATYVYSATAWFFGS